MKKFIDELQRRKMIKSAVAYLVTAWLITQVTAIIIPAFELPKNFLRTVIVVLIIFLPVWLMFSWMYKITPEGIQKIPAHDTDLEIDPKISKRYNRITFSALGLAVVLLIYTLTRPGVASTDTSANETSAAAAATDKSIAVLAFADMSQNRDQEYFSDGISEEILNLLTHVPQLKVISRTSSFSYKGKSVDIKQIGEELHVSHILEGSIRKSRNTFRITAQLIDAATGANVWADTYERDIEDVFKIQDEIATKVTQQLKISLLGNPLTSPIASTDAYMIYLQARQLYLQKSKENTEKAIEMINQSLAIDSTFAPAWTLKSSLYYQAVFRFIVVERDEGIRMGRAAALKALEMDSGYVGGYLTLANFEHALWNFDSRDRLMAKAVKLDPGNPSVIYSQSDYASQSGHMDKAIELLYKTMELDPLHDWLHYYNLGLYYWMDGKYLEAEERIRQFLIIHPENAFLNCFMAEIQIALNKPDKAIEFIDKRSDGGFWAMYRKPKALYAMGKIKEADMALEEFINAFGDVAWPNIADVYALRGEKDEAFKWLEFAYENRDISILEILNYQSMRNLWGDPRWNKLILKLKLPKNHGYHID